MAADFFPDERSVVTTTTTGVASVRHVESGTELMRLKLPLAGLQAEVASDGGHLAVVLYDKVVLIPLMRGGSDARLRCSNVHQIRDERLVAARAARCQ